MQTPAEAADPIVPTITLAQFFKVFPSVCLPMFLASVDGTIVATALPNIAGSLGDVERVSWVVVAYLMATTIAAPVYGKLGDVLGRRRLLFFALTVFLVASLCCALAPTMLALIAARVLQGAGGGGLMTLSQALVGEIVPPRERPRFQGYLAGTFMVSSTFGPVAGGYLTLHFGWASVFYVNLPLGILAMALAFRLPDRKQAGGNFHFDWLGIVLLTGFVVPLLLALERAQRLSVGAVPLIVTLVAISVVSLWLLLKQERRAASPLIPIRILSHPSIWRADAMAACVGATIVGAVTFMPIYLQVVRGADPAEVGLLLLPLTAGIAVGSIMTGRLMVKTQRTAVFPSFGQPVVAAGWAVLGVFGPSIPLHWLPLLFIVISVATGTTMPVVQLTGADRGRPEKPRRRIRQRAIHPLDRRSTRDRDGGRGAVCRPGRPGPGGRRPIRRHRRTRPASADRSRCGHARRARGRYRRGVPGGVPDHRRLQPVRGGPGVVDAVTPDRLARTRIGGSRCAGRPCRRGRGRSCCPIASASKAADCHS